MDKKNDIISIFVERMKKLNIEVEICGNYPWIYLEYVNGNRVKEKFLGNHGFTIAFLPIKKDQKMEFTDIGKIFEIIRKYR